jgi:hypothetical protein
MLIVKIVLHYADFVKDIILLTLIWKHTLGGSTRTFLEDILEFPVVVFLIICTSIFTTELLSVHTLVTSSIYEGYENYKKVGSMLLFPFIPAIVRYHEFKLQLQLLHILSKAKRNKSKTNSEFKICTKSI